MRENDIVISGSTALHFLSRNNPSFSSWTSNDIDFYCPKSQATVLVDFVVSHGYSVILEEDDYPTKNSEYLLPGMCSHTER